MKNNNLTSLPNIGDKLAALLLQIGVQNKDDIESFGPARIYNRLQEVSEKRLPVCYYLYSLDAAIKGVDWRELSNEQKAELRKQAGLQ